MQNSQLFFIAAIYLSLKIETHTNEKKTKRFV